MCQQLDGSSEGSIYRWVLFSFPGSWKSAIVRGRIIIPLSINNKYRKTCNIIQLPCISQASRLQAVLFEMLWIGKEGLRVKNSRLIAGRLSARGWLLCLPWDSLYRSSPGGFLLVQCRPLSVGYSRLQSYRNWRARPMENELLEDHTFPSPRRLQSRWIKSEIRRINIPPFKGFAWLSYLFCLSVYVIYGPPIVIVWIEWEWGEIPHQVVQGWNQPKVPILLHELWSPRYAKISILSSHKSQQWAWNISLSFCKYSSCKGLLCGMSPKPPPTCPAFQHEAPQMKVAPTMLMPLHACRRLINPWGHLSAVVMAA